MTILVVYSVAVENPWGEKYFLTQLVGFTYLDNGFQYRLQGVDRCKKDNIFSQQF